MTELGLEMKVVGKNVAKFESQAGKTTYSYKGIVDGVKALEGFLEAYEKVFNELVEKNKTIGELKKFDILRDYK